MHHPSEDSPVCICGDTGWVYGKSEYGRCPVCYDVIDFCKGIIFPMYLAEESYSMDSDLEFEEYWRNL